MTFSPGDILLGKYRIDRFIGAGAFAEVYQATHLRLNAVYALKVLRRDESGLGSSEYGRWVERFRQEARLGAALKSAHIVPVYDYEEEYDLLILRMDYLPGGSLADRLARLKAEDKLMPGKEALRIAVEVAQGLAAMHDKDVVHRDVKPSNILFAADGRALVADLGLAQVPGGASMRSVLSQAAPHPGTPAYMSPEQVRSNEHLTSASDVYALGAVLFEMLTGRVYKSQRPGMTVDKLRPGTPSWVVDVLQRMLARDPGQRPWNGAEVAEALRTGAEEASRREEARHHGAEEAKQSAVPQRNRTPVWQQIGIDLVTIPAGEFLMGSDSRLDGWAFGREKPQHRVLLPVYQLARTPVTNRQYKAYVDASGAEAPSYWRGGQIPAGKEDHPVVYISWLEALDFCKWVGLRLPTEAEWEKAARGTDGRLYPWGSELPDEKRCNSGNHERGTTPVGKYPAGASPYGLLDMVGSVWQWTSSLERSYPYRADDGRENLQVDGRRVLRGGTWRLGPKLVRVAHRGSGIPGRRDFARGFRCARSL